LVHQPGIELVVHDDLVVLRVEGRLDQDLLTDLKAWWAEQIHDLS